MKNEKKLHRFSYYKNIANFEAFWRDRNFSKNLLFLGSASSPEFFLKVYKNVICDILHISSFYPFLAFVYSNASKQRKQTNTNNDKISWSKMVCYVEYMVLGRSYLYYSQQAILDSYVFFATSNNFKTTTYIWCKRYFFSSQNMTCIEQYYNLTHRGYKYEFQVYNAKTQQTLK